MAATEDLEQELARRNALSVAALLVDGCSDGTAVPVEAAVRIGVELLARWRTAADVRAALRPLFEAAVPDQRALIALGDVDAWLPGGAVARSWWEWAAAGPDPELSALGAWRAAQAALRGGREEDALPLLHQAATAGIRGAALAFGRIVQRRAGDDAAARLCHRYGSVESMLRLAEAALDADDLDAAEREITHLDAGPHTPVTPGVPDLPAWEAAVRGEIAFRRGHLERAEALLGRARSAPGDRGRHAELRLAQLAIVGRDPGPAYFWTSLLTEGTDPVAEQARLLVHLHRDLIDEGARYEQDDDEED